MHYTKSLFCVSAAVVVDPDLWGEWLREPCENSGGSGFLFQLKGPRCQQMNHWLALGSLDPLDPNKSLTCEGAKSNVSALRTVDLSLLFSQWHGSFSRFEPLLSASDLLTQWLRSPILFDNWLWWTAVGKKVLEDKKKPHTQTEKLIRYTPW